MSTEPSVPPPEPELAPDYRAQLLRDELHLLSGQIIDLKAAHRTDDVRTAEKRIAEIRLRLAVLAGGPQITAPQDSP